MAGGTICFRLHRKLIHRESSRASVLNPSGGHAVLHSIATEKCLLTTPSLLSRGTRPQVQGGGTVRRVRRELERQNGCEQYRNMDIDSNMQIFQMEPVDTLLIKRE